MVLTVMMNDDGSLPKLQVTVVKEQPANEEDNLNEVPGVTIFRALTEEDMKNRKKKPQRDKFSRTFQDDTIDSQDSLDEYKLHCEY